MAFVHSKVRNRLGIAKAGKLVFIYKLLNTHKSFLLVLRTLIHTYSNFSLSSLIFILIFRFLSLKHSIIRR